MPTIASRRKQLAKITEELTERDLIALSDAACKANSSLRCARAKVDALEAESVAAEQAYANACIAAAAAYPDNETFARLAAYWRSNLKETP